MLRWSVGSGQHVMGAGRDYTALGDAVNLAFRLESASKDLNTDVVVGPDSYKLLSSEIWVNNLKSVTVKGKEKPVTACALTFKELADWLKDHA